MTKKKKTAGKISIKDYIKAVKKADREDELSQSPGWRRTTNVHKSKKVYNRKREKRDISKE
ncbi:MULTISPECIES: hypothetical protein [Dysgonomonas]|uniref:hypothetical protein n=1 Tax=Dysgonomonas TaxID=156973 RepID=UPI000928D87E|nr:MULTISPECIES: hypothetical protein [Dysgonomonas]MBN9302361.1 hypothetical protein [Dysgonomonas mossii]OJX64278.1 MAG: hypothetical protein BGO84_09450 [Dysgonomonas sp. 37-18]